MYKLGTSPLKVSQLSLLHFVLSLLFLWSFSFTYQTSMAIKTGKRNAAPAHYKLKFENFSIAKTKIDRYESETFDAAGYQWKLVVYPNGNTKRGAAGHVSIYLAMAAKSTLPSGWQVQVNFKMFVFDFNMDQYFTIEDDDREWRFQDFKSEWGFDKLMSVADLDTSKGYLSEDDNCIFGVEVFLITYTGKGESVSIIQNPEDNLYSWPIPNFSKLDGRPRESDAFVIGGQKWKLTLYPKGDTAARGETLSLDLKLQDRIIPPGQKMYVTYTLRVKNKFPGVADSEKEESFWFSPGAATHGVSKLISLSDLKAPSKGFLYNDIITVEVEFTMISQVKDFS